MTSDKTSEICEPMVSPDKYHKLEHENETLKEIIIELNKKILELKKTPNTKICTDYLENYMAFQKKAQQQCPYCGSTNIQYMYGSALMSTTENQFSFHYICKDCQKEFEV